MESKLIAAAIKSREAFGELLVTEVEQEFSDKASLIWDEIKEYYGNDPESMSVDLEILKSKLKRKAPKHVDMLFTYFDGIDEVSIPNLMKEVVGVKLEYTSHSMAQELVAGNFEKFEDMLDNYNSLRSGELKEKADTEVFINPSIEHIISESSGDNRIAILPSTLNAHLKGGVLRGHHVVVFAPTDMGKTLWGLNMAYGFLKQNLKVLYCYAKNTQVLTSTGWKRFEDITYEDKVAQVTEHMTTEFVHPQNIIKQKYKGDMVRLKNKTSRVELLVTPEHSMVTGYKGKIRTSMMKDTKYYQGIQHFTSARSGRRDGRHRLSTHERLLLAVQADGTLLDSDNHIRIKVIKPRKIDRLQSLLELSGYKYKESIIQKGVKQGYHVFTIYEQSLRDKTFNWIDYDNAHGEWCKDFIRELSEWDGHKRKDRSSIVYVTTDYNNSEHVQAVAALAGYECNKHKVEDSRKTTFSDCYYLNIRLTTSPTDGGCLEKSMEAYDDYIYCVTVPEGKLLVKYNDTVSVSGNCGNEDPANDMIMRLMWRVTGMTEEEIRDKPETAQKLLDERNFSNLVFVELAPGTRHEIEDLIIEHEPDVLMVDQIRNLDMGDANKVIALEKAAAMMRMFGKKYNLVPVSFTQAGDSATGKMLLSRGDIDFSNVGIPGTADLLLGIGATDEMESKGERMISFVKNKISGNKQPIKVWFDNKLTRVT